MGRGRLIAIVFGLAIIVALTLLRAYDPYPVRIARETSFDLFQQLKPRQAPPGLPIRIVDIDEPSLAALGQWPWPRSLMATLAERLTELGAAAVVFDVLFSEPDRLSSIGGRDFDAEFARALADAPSVLSLARSGRAGQVAVPAKAGIAMTGSATLAGLPVLDGATQPVPQLAEAARGLGVASLDRDGASVVRRLPLLWRSGDGVVPALSVEALRMAVGVPTLVILGDSAEAGTVENIRIGDLDVPTGPQGEIWLYYRHLDPSIYVSARDLLADDYARLAPQFGGQIVLIGTSASGLLDIRSSPLDVAVPGVSIHAQALEQMLTGTYLNRADWVSGLEILAFVVLGLVIVMAMVFAGPIVALVVSLCVVLGQLGLSWWAFSGPGWLIDPSFAAFGALVLYAAIAFVRFAVSDADRRRIRRAFAHYVEPSLLSQIEADSSLLRLGGDTRDLTVMFSDVRNFSGLAERTEPAALVATLNRLFAALGDAIVRHLGTIDKFMGDSVMAFWNAPANVDRHALRACCAALDMRGALVALNAGASQPIGIGIGIAAGPALVGNVGFEKRFDYSCIGDTVNVASRVEGACRAVAHDILVTERVRQEAPELAFLFAGAVPLKGMSEREPIYALLGDDALRGTAAFQQLSQAHDQLVAALASGALITPALEHCQRLAIAVDKHLMGFYTAIAQRPEDFRDTGQPPTPAKVSALSGNPLQ